MAEKPTKKMEWVSHKAYEFGSMENSRYDKVRRENIIVKQTRGAGGFTNKVRGI